MTDTTTNQGVTGAGNSYTYFYLSTNGVAKGSYLGYRSLASLAAGSSSGPVTTSLTLPGNLSGNYYLIACADGGNSVLENNETNNCLASAFAVH